jgi:hypothetical protein
MEELKLTMNNLSLNNWCPGHDSKHSTPETQKYYQLSQLSQSVECWVSSPFHTVHVDTTDNDWNVRSVSSDAHDPKRSINYVGDSLTVISWTLRVLTSLSW